MNKAEVYTKLKDNKLPAGWVKIRLGELGKFKTSSVDKKVDKNEKPVRLINYMDVYRENLIGNSLKLMEVTANNHEITVSQVRKGDILFTPSSETPDDIGHSAVVLEDLPNTLYSYHLVRLTIRESISIDLKFRGYFCNFKEVLRQFEQSSTGVTRYTLSKKDFEEVEIILPISPMEQQKIAEILETVDETIEKTDAIIEKYKRIKQGSMQELLTRGIDENGQIRSEETHKFKDSSLGRIPEEWEVVELKDVLKYKQPYNYIVESTKYEETGIPVLTAGKTFILGYANENKCICFDVPVIIFDDFTTESKFVNFPFKVKSSAMKFLKEKNKEKVVLKYIFESMQLIKYPSIGGDHKRRWISEFQNICTPLPPFPEQCRIVFILSQIDETIEKEQKYKEKLERIKQGLMENLLTGKVRVLNVN